MAKYRDPKVRVASAYGNTRRIARNPSFPFQLRTRPFQVQPFMAAPVLPGETLKSLVTMSRVVTKPLANPLIGWWCEYYYFYVRLRDIEFHLKDTKGLWLDAMVTAGTEPTSLKVASANPKFYHAANSIPWMQYAMQTVVEYYFRDQGEDWDVAALDGVPLAQISGKSWLDSLTLDSDKRDRRVDLDLDADGKVEADELMNGYEHWQLLREAGLETMDYEDWIRTFGVQVPEVESSFNKYRPELLRYVRSWQYPTNTIDPATGTPSSAVSWVNAHRGDKDRLFREPGFVIGLTVQKPKTFISDLSGQLAGFMTTLDNWLPALQQKDYEHGFKKFDAGAGPLGGSAISADAYWIDLRDLLVHGDQFLNFAADTKSSAVSVIGAAGQSRYASATQIDALFSGTDKYIQSDGVTNLSILGRQMDMTPGRKVL